MREAGKSQKNLVKQVLIVMLVVVALVWAAFPFYWALVTSIKPAGEVFEIPFLSIPFVQFIPTLQEWSEQLKIRETRQAMLNSVIVSTCSTILALALGTPAGYALARFRYCWIKNKDIMVWFLSQRVLPPVVVLVPFYVILTSIGLDDTLLALILIYTTFIMPFAVIIMCQIFKELPVELEEAALVDGYTRWGVFLKVAVPLAAPALASTAMICLAFSWNEFLFAMALGKVDAKTIPVIIAGAEHSRGVDFAVVGTRALMAMAVPVVLALLAKRFIVRGLTFGAVKG